MTHRPVTVVLAGDRVSDVVRVHFTCGCGAVGRYLVAHHCEGAVPVERFTRALRVKHVAEALCGATFGGSLTPEEAR